METRIQVAVYLFLCLAGASHAIPTPCGQEGDVQLVFLGTNAGRVEICSRHPQSGELVYGTICTESPESFWSKKNADVACRSLNYERGAVNSILPITTTVADIDIPIYYSSVVCNGTESSLLECSISTSITDCTHDYDAAVTCVSGFSQDGDIRLLGSVFDGLGAVEIYSAGIWRGICVDDGTWNDDVADLLCIQLGYNSGSSTSYSSTSLITSSTVRWQSFDCSFSNLISECSYTPTFSCASLLVGGVTCFKSSDADGTIRLDGSIDSHRGRLEILIGGRWGTLCQTGWDSTAADVACRELGFGDYLDAFPSLTFSGDSDFKPVWYNDISCFSTDDSISDCVSTFPFPTGYGSCADEFDSKADVECENDGSVSLSGGAIFGIVFGVIVVIGGGIALGNIYVRPWWAKREQYGWYRTVQHPQRSFEGWWSRNVGSSNTATTTTTTAASRAAARVPDPAPTVTPTVPDPTPAAAFNLPSARARASDRSSSSSSEAESEPQASAASPPESHPEAKLTRGEPPSYRAARSFPRPSESSEPDEKPPIEDLPPPYPGPTQNVYPPPSAPPVGVAPYPANPVPVNYQGYPAPSNLAYPPTFDPAYPPSGSVPPGALPYPDPGIPPEEFASAPYQSGQ